MPLLNIGATMGSGQQPTIGISPATQSRNEGDGGTTRFSFTVTLVRNGSTAAVNYSWSVAGSGGNPASASDFAGGVLPSGSGTFASGETVKTIDVDVAGDAVAEANEAFTLSVSAAMALSGTSATATILNDDSTPPALLMTSRAVVMGSGGMVGSDGVDMDGNSRIALWNETGASVTKFRTYWANWFANSVNEQNGYNDISVKASVEYPAGTFTPVTFGGSASAVTIHAADMTVESDEVILTIPAGAQFWVRSWVSVASGGKWPQGYIVQTARGEAADFATGVDKTTGGTIANTTATVNRRGYGPVAVKATGFGSVPVAKAFAAIGDSIVMGSTDGNYSTRGNTGYFARACDSAYPCVNYGIAGTTAFSNLAANMPRRLDLLGRIGVTHVFCNWASNDIAGGRTAAQVQGNVQNIIASIKTAVPAAKLVWQTCLPRSTSTDGWITPANQVPMATPANAWTAGTGSVRAQWNALLRTGGVAGVDILFEGADAVETGRDTGIWRAGDGSAHLTAIAATTDKATTDGIHPSVLNVTAPGYGGIYSLKDAVEAVIAGW